TFPISPIQLGNYIEVLPKDNTIPYMPEYQWIHTPGHSPGHVSFYREKDKTLIAGDAFTTVKQDSLYKTLSQKVEINGPLRYLTTDWQAAWDSVKKLEALQPNFAVTGPGMPLSGWLLLRSL